MPVPGKEGTLRPYRPCKVLLAKGGKREGNVRKKNMFKDGSKTFIVEQKDLGVGGKNQLSLSARWRKKTWGGGEEKDGIPWTLRGRGVLGAQRT